MHAKFDLRLGVDVGGSNTDAVVLDRDAHVLAQCKQPTTSDVTTGLIAAIRAVLENPAVDRTRVTHVMIGTTHATNAVLERRGLRRVAVVRIGSPSADAIRPLFGWPEDLRDQVCADIAMIRGGFEIDGRESTAFDEQSLETFLKALPADIGGVAVTSVFSPVSATHELAARELVHRTLGRQVHVSLSHEIGSLGLLARENATVLNEALVGVSATVAAAISAAMVASGLADPMVFFAQNDGTLMNADFALDYPVLTIGSGPANSIRGAAYLTGVDDAIVADVGGTSTDIGVLVNGFPRESSVGVTIGGTDTNFRMPDLVSIAIGGGTTITRQNERTQLGPGSVGYRISTEALVFGGSTATLTDAAVATKRASIGRCDPAADALMLAEALQQSDARIGEAIDQMKNGKNPVPLIVVGGGSALIPDDIPGVSKVLRPPNHEVANAIGAAIGAVSGHTDRIFAMNGSSREALLETATSLAGEQAIRAGADPSAIAVVDLEEIPLSYTTEPVTRIRVKVAGPLDAL